MTKSDIELLIFAVNKIQLNSDRKRVVQTILPLLYRKTGKKFNAIQFCIDCNVPALL